MRAAAAVLAADGDALCELARRVNSLRGATGEGTERETAEKGRKGRSLARSLTLPPLAQRPPTGRGCAFASAVVPFCFQVLFCGGKVK